MCIELESIFNEEKIQRDLAIISFVWVISTKVYKLVNSDIKSIIYEDILRKSMI